MADQRTDAFEPEPEWDPVEMVAHTVGVLLLILVAAGIATWVLG